MKKTVMAIFIVLLSISVLAANNSKKHIRFEDENGDARTDITSITIWDTGTTTASTLYTDIGGTVTMTNPITISSTNTGLNAGQGELIFCSADSTFDMTVTLNGVDVRFDSVVATKKRFMIPVVATTTNAVSRASNTTNDISTGYGVRAYFISPYGTAHYSKLLGQHWYLYGNLWYYDFSRSDGGYPSIQMALPATGPEIWYSGIDPFKIGNGTAESQGEDICLDLSTTANVLDITSSSGVTNIQTALNYRVDSNTYYLTKTLKRTIGHVKTISNFAYYTTTDPNTTLCTLTGHGFSEGDEITIFDPNEENYTGDFTVHVVDANSFYIDVDLSPANNDANGLITAYPGVDFCWAGDDDTSEYVIDVGTIIPAYARVMDIALINTEGVTAEVTSFVVEAGSTSSGNQYFSSATVFAANSINALAAAGSPAVAISSSAGHVYLAGTPGANWNLMTDGAWTLIVSYNDYAVIK